MSKHFTPKKYVDVNGILLKVFINKRNHLTRVPTMCCTGSGGGVCLRDGCVLVRGVPPEFCLYRGRCMARRGVYTSIPSGREVPPNCGKISWQTVVKIWPCHKLVGEGNKLKFIVAFVSTNAAFVVTQYFPGIAKCQCYWRTGNCMFPTCCVSHSCQHCHACLIKWKCIYK